MAYFEPDVYGIEVHLLSIKTKTPIASSWMGREISSEAGDRDEALAALKAGHHPDIVLMGVSLKTDLGFGIIKSMHSRIRALPMLVVSLHGDGIYAERALRAGARGYVMKQESGKKLVIAIREVLRGNSYLSKPMQARLLNRVATGNSENELLISLAPASFKYCV